MGNLKKCSISSEIVNCFGMRNFYPNTIDSMQLQYCTWPESNVFRNHISSEGCYISAILQGSIDHDSGVSQNRGDPEILQKFRITL